MIDTELYRRWWKRFGRRAEGDTAVRLLCFHHAGGTAAAFRRWPRLLPPWVEVLAVQLPGRADRLNEPAYRRMPDLLADLVEVLDPLLDRPFACFGASLGARTAYGLADTLRERNLPQPVALFLACCAAPGLDDLDAPGANVRWQRTDAGQAAWELLRAVGGELPAAILAEPDLARAVLSTLHCDVSVFTSQQRPAEPLAVPIHAFAAEQDATVGIERVRGWRRETTASFSLDQVPGPHLLDPAAAQQVTAAIAADLGSVRAAGVR